MSRKDLLDRKKDILKWMGENRSKAFISRELKCKPETLNHWLMIMGIEYDGNQSSKGRPSFNRKSAKEYLSSSGYISGHKLKIKLIEDGIREHECERCRRKTWLGEKIPLELHHIDGNRFNNVIDNIKLLCPNCHSSTTNNSGKNIGRYK